MNNCTIDLSSCNCNRSAELDCLTNTFVNCGCPVIPSWSLFQETLNNPTIITNLETDGTYTSVGKLIDATVAEVELVPGIGPASSAALATALGVYNLGFRP